MANIFEGSKVNTILKDERYLYPDFVPEQLPFRDREIGEMVFCLKPATQGKKPSNLFLTGVPGSGKTVSSKYVLSELSEFSDRTKTIYINCFENNSQNSILVKLTNLLGYPIPNRGLAIEEIFQRFIAVLRTKKIIPIVVFDEAEQLLKKEDTKKLLYDFSRLGEQFNLFLGMIFISNDPNFLSLLDDRVRSSLHASTLTFEKYTSLELKEILKKRANFAFFPNTLENEVIPLSAAHASRLGDARIAITVLLNAARLAEKENSKIVKVEHVRKSFMVERPVKVEISSNLTKQEQLILDFLVDKEVTAGEIYLKFKKDFAERTLRKAITDLESKGVISAKKVKKGRGITRLLSKKAK